MKQLIITGGSGYLGKRLIEHALQAGYQVVVLARSNKNIPSNITIVPWALGQTLPLLPAFVEPRTASLIHFAHDWKNELGPKGEEGYLNWHGTKVLADSALAVGIRKFVFVSSQSAREDALNIYGRVKWKTEQVLDGPDIVCARVGLVYGGRKEAMFGLLHKLAGLPILPMVNPSRKVQPIHVDEVCRGLLTLADASWSGCKGLAGPQPIAFADLLRLLARQAHGRKLTIIPLPLEFALWAARMMSRVPFLPVVDPERILGLAGTEVMDCTEDLNVIGFDVQPMEMNLRHSALGLRGIFVEARTLLSYVLAIKPSGSLLRRYVKAVGEQGPVGLSPICIIVPALTRFYEPFGNKSLLARRLRLVSALVDSSFEGAQIFYQKQNLFALGFWVVGDILAIPFRMLSTLFAR